MIKDFTRFSAACTQIKMTPTIVVLMSLLLSSAVISISEVQANHVSGNCIGSEEESKCMNLPLKIGECTSFDTGTTSISDSHLHFHTKIGYPGISLKMC